ncbi:hypothetical protein O6H91_07G087200 [Diphasiastrum complanatum]|uniref:Uncharacterized protein n=1 Tax=Diphasiastrum complanatum TaxID=34168 RepID=A0ACC2D778_DIPCM|nr:hypothetical protein O6H91_07G087200 [Diphasiastrum complanatum]
MAGRRLANILSHLRCSPFETVHIGADENVTSLACQRQPHAPLLLNGRRIPASKCLCKNLEGKEAGEGKKCGAGLGRENGEESKVALQFMQDRSISRQPMHVTGDICSKEGLSDAKSRIDAMKSCNGCIKIEDMSISGRELLLPSVSPLFCRGSSDPLDAARRENTGARDAADQRLAANSNESGCVNGEQSQHTRGYTRSDCSNPDRGNGMCNGDSYHHKESGNCRVSGSNTRLEGHVVSDKKQIASISNLEIAYNNPSDTDCSQLSDAEECNKKFQKIDTRVNEDFKELPKRIVSDAFSPQNSPPLRSRSKADQSSSSGNRCSKPVLISASSQDCVFCNIVQGRAPAFKLYEDDHCICILDINPLCYGHSLIIPKAHFPSLEATPPQVAAAMCAVIPLISRVLMDATQRDAFNMVVNNGSAAGQVVFHTHFHIVPRILGDGLWTAEE